jgi:hypothetical protein
MQSSMKILKVCIALLFVSLISSTLLAQSKVWTKLDKGQAVYIDPYKQEWLPLAAKEEVPIKTFMLLKPESQVTFFKETDSYLMQGAGYVYIEDVYPKVKTELVAALTRIEAAELPPNPSEKEKKVRPLGVSYGEPRVDTTGSGEVPYFTERQQTIEQFLKQNRPDAALLTLKRMMTKYPSLYQNKNYVDLLMQLYDKLELYGLMGDETRRLLAVKQSSEISSITLRWNEIAKQKLTKGKP